MQKYNSLQGKEKTETETEMIVLYIPNLFYKCNV